MRRIRIRLNAFARRFGGDHEGRLIRTCFRERHARFAQLAISDYLANPNQE